MVVAGGADGLLRFCDVVSGHRLWTLQAHKSQLLGIYLQGDDILTREFGGDVSRWTLPRSESVIEATVAQ